MPADYQVARPVAAPNYVQMYSEGIRGALEPYNYLLNMQKELSEEDLRKGQIQNFLDEHQDKANALAEDTRSHKATEAMTLLERNIEQQRADETGRHDLADEAHESRADALAKQRDDEVERHNKAAELQLQKDLDLRTAAQGTDLELKKAQTREATSIADQRTFELKNQQNDNDVLDKLNKDLQNYGPDEIYGAADNPELQHLLDEARLNTRTTEGRQRMDELIGPLTALGRENKERIELNGMSSQAKDAFQDNMLSSAPSGPEASTKPTQSRFSDAMKVARDVDGRVKERANWTDAGTEAYKRAKLEGKDELTAQGVGRLANDSALYAAKSKIDEKPDPNMIKQLVEKMRGLVPRLKDDKGIEESDQDFNDRADAINLPKAVKMEQEGRLGTGNAKIDATTVMPDAAKPTDADAFTKKLLPDKATGAPKGNQNQTLDTNSSLTPTTMSGSSSSGSLIPVSAPRYAAASQDAQGDLFASMRSIFGSPFGSQSGETDDSDVATV